ncbi:hypothetical protein [Desnuesiella massiliensis]|uniref:hypothetical protein n=1 Tax=Desnuesiella massiliensis TaxID=1650662 RepID=UPI0006E19EC3|nr:hypothetical protein [Desnuesiella massiliensis]
MKAVKINLKNRNLSLINEILLKIFYISISIVSIIAFISYISVYESEKNKQLEELRAYVSERVRIDSEIFKLAEDNLKIFEKEFMKLYNSDIKVTEDEFWSYYFIDNQGATRMKREYFAGITEYNNTFNSPEEIIKVADEKLYMAKGKGRNCLEI